MKTIRTIVCFLDLLIEQTTARTIGRKHSVKTLWKMAKLLNQI